MVGAALQRVERQLQAPVQALLVRLLQPGGDGALKKSALRMHLPQFLLQVGSTYLQG